MNMDPIVEEVRQARRLIETVCGKDPLRYAARLREIEIKFSDRLVCRAIRTTPGMPV